VDHAIVLLLSPPLILLFGLVAAFKVPPVTLEDGPLMVFWEPVTRPPVLL
jgi:hypothetical protein